MSSSDRLSYGARRFLSRYLRDLDTGTREHIFEVINMCRRLGEIFELSETEFELLILAAQYHDLGKGNKLISPLIQQPRAPTSQEWAIINRHPEFSGRILKATGGVAEEVINLILAHHDPVTYQGKYLKILVVLGVADMIQAMTSKRPYRKDPMEKGDVIFEIQLKYGGLIEIIGGEPALWELFSYLVRSKKEESSSPLFMSPGL